MYVTVALLWCDAVSASDNIFKRHIVIRYEHHQNKRLAEIKQNDSMETKLNLSTQLVEI